MKLAKITLTTLAAFVWAGTLAASDVFITEIADPNNSSTTGRFVELFNIGSSDIDLSAAGYKIQRWTNGNADPTSASIKDLTGTIPAGGFYIICNDSSKFSDFLGLNGFPLEGNETCATFLDFKYFILSHIFLSTRTSPIPTRFT